MDLDTLHAFVVAAETGNLTRAAAKLGVAQPSLSQRIAKLERDLGRSVFDRLGRGVSLTEAGRVLLERARDILIAVENAEREIRASGSAIAGRLRVGSIATFAQLRLPSIVGAFMRDFPEVELIIHESASDDLITRTLDGDLDLAIVSRRIETDRLTLEPLLTETYQLALPRRHELASRKTTRATDLRSSRFVVLEPRSGLPTMTIDFCRAHGFEPEVACRSAQLATVQAMVGAGLGVSFVPAMAADADRSGLLIYRELTGARPRRTIALASHRLRSPAPAAREFMSRLRHTFILKK